MAPLDGALALPQMQRRPVAVGEKLDFDVARALEVALDVNRVVTEGSACLVSGSGNVAQYTVDKLISLGARAVTLSTSRKLFAVRG